jgi:PTS system mannose-specific IID component
MRQNSVGPFEIKGVSRQVFFRSFFLETIWNNEKLQNIGFSFCIYPALKRLFPDQDDKKKAVCRQLEPVNTHPSMGPLLVGVVARLEGESDASTVLTYRKRIMAALGGHGDRLFWGYLRPLASLWGALIGFIFFGSLWGSLVTLAIYNIPQLTLRYYGFVIGIREGVEAVRLLKSWKIAAAVEGIGALFALGLGGLAGISVILALKNPKMPDGDSLLLFLLTGGLIAILSLLASLFRRLPTSLLIYLAAFLAVAIFMLANGTFSV